MERADPDPESRHQGLDPLAHLAGGLVGERDGQDCSGAIPECEQVGDPPGDDPRLARAGAGQDQQRALDVGHGLALGGGQISEQVHQWVLPWDIEQGPVADRIGARGSGLS